MNLKETTTNHRSIKAITCKTFVVRNDISSG